MLQITYEDNSIDICNINSGQTKKRTLSLGVKKTKATIHTPKAIINPQEKFTTKVLLKMKKRKRDQIIQTPETDDSENSQEESLEPPTKRQKTE